MADPRVPEACQYCDKPFQHEEPIVYFRCAEYKALRDAGHHELINKHYTWVPKMEPCAPEPKFSSSYKGRAICMQCATTLKLADMI